LFKRGTRKDTEMSSKSLKTRDEPENARGRGGMQSSGMSGQAVRQR
jgi:hypothetical protein